MAVAQEDHLHGIAQLLVQEKLLDREKALIYQKAAVANKLSLQQYLVANRILSAKQIAVSVAQNFGVPLIDLDCVDLDAIPAAIVSDKLIKRHGLIPLFNRGKQLYLAMDDPSKHSSLKEIQFHTGLYPTPLVVETDKLQDFIDNLLHEKESQGLAHYFEESQEIDGVEFSTDDEEKEAETLGLSSEDAPIVKFVNRIVVEAIKKGASDIHFEPYERTFRIRYRQDGILNEVTAPPISLASRIAARIKVMANLDISERRIPQDGRFKLKLSPTRSVDFRVSTCPTVAGEKVVMRLLDPGATKLGIESLGFSKTQKEHFLRAVGRPQGMILVTGPTGSGKTVTLYSALNLLNTPERNISTAEDPVEIKVSGINQVNINPKAGLTFSGTLRSFLRQDPDIIMVGEIRDLETAEIAIKAAQTGHLVLSTLHTNSAAESLTRLVNMGIPSFNIASSVSLIIAQRLVRRLCEQCKMIRDDIPASSLLELGFSETDIKNLHIYKAEGCSQCTNGYRGRIGLFEVMPMSKELGGLIMSGGNSLDILHIAQKEGMVTIYQSGLQKIKEGVTTIEEVNRVTVD
ncbi:MULTISPECIES: type IV-A pilus assembly ATPase PilB [Legionella]|uniref:Type IV-A pilus assembly ATPase PilB n=1 Tax=Legionella septentrionalis TaxID=2498109 RepID=A0A433JGL5_9GAMM|nr:MULTISPECIES: type IV-A pilus assembly ATPase PilB [Legionella]MCP0913283.1 type IV-A pilus assembly ATPase PilB [Legionella sp. 27cVA30]RUQ79577.1 type IV-A pilus assembly ATPase PilB [Legionella septentrionalis]RUQ97966.1 type IV-A pilus assembly ATPase PilB [Legionella septentrionalis]RUR08828.1 type IV-A pilus assembly ATPase PilB [Legionella septentrionalis]RUR14707.1 type IV-A pilus assembly ATPase PilB [Legionella septentrionalis]